MDWPPSTSMKKIFRSPDKVFGAERGAGEKQQAGEAAGELQRRKAWTS